jgi:hypothetical protein
MRLRSLLTVVAALAVVRSFAGCTHEAGPGEECEGSMVLEISCPDGYVCDDKKDWTCQPQEQYPSTNDDPSAATPTTPAPSTRGTRDADVEDVHRDMDARAAVSDADASDGGSDASSDADAGEAAAE